MQANYISRPAVARAAAPSKLSDRYLTWLGFVLLGYALLGRGFAYIGFAPLFIGEITMLLGLVVLAMSRAKRQVFSQPTMFFLSIFVFWGLCRTVPYISTYGVSALRDAVLWGYSVFAVIAAALIIEKPSRLKLLVLRYRTFATLFIVLMLALYAITTVAPNAIPYTPGTEVPIVHIKPGDVQVHLGAIAVFFLLGLSPTRLWEVFLLTGQLFVGGIYNRGGMVSAALAIFTVIVLKPSVTSKLTRLGFGLAVLLIAFTIIDPTISLDRKEVSVEQLWLNVTSVFNDTGNQRLSSTKEWRLKWWTDIMNYTVYGPYFWTGKGFGINLANSDGYQVASDDSVRSPHNGHLSVLARAGVPGFILWMLLHISWGLQMLSGYMRASAQNDRAWSSVFIFLMAYWVAFMANATFDVFLEGPMGGIWFWTLFGIGLGALHVYEHRPEVLWARQPASAQG